MIESHGVDLNKACDNDGRTCYYLDIAKAIECEFCKFLRTRVLLSEKTEDP